MPFVVCAMPVAWKWGCMHPPFMERPSLDSDSQTQLSSFSCTQPCQHRWGSVGARRAFSPLKTHFFSRSLCCRN